MKLMGVDVGFSKTRRSTGIACLDENGLRGLEHTKTDWKFREAAIPSGFRPSLIALDGPLVPLGMRVASRRCESAFSRAPFHNRCKPGLSHSVIGQDLLRATRKACDEFGALLKGTASPQFAISRNGPVVEAFPNAFLAVLMSDEEFIAQPPHDRGRRFDWLYKQMKDRLRDKLAKELDLTDEIWQHVNITSNHDEKAALICLLTAALAAKGRATAIGDPKGGWFWLPHRSLWEQWAKHGLDAVAAEMTRNGEPLDVFDGLRA